MPIVLLKGYLRKKYYIQILYDMSGYYSPTDFAFSSDSYVLIFFIVRWSCRQGIETFFNEKDN